VLKAAIQSYLSFSSYENIIILDNGSDYPPLLDYLKELELKGASVKYLSTAFTHAERAQLKNPIKAENDRRKAEYYVVTDPDIAFHDAPSDLLQTLIKIINQPSTTFQKNTQYVNMPGSDTWSNFGCTNQRR